MILCIRELLLQSIHDHVGFNEPGRFHGKFLCLFLSFLERCHRTINRRAQLGLLEVERRVVLPRLIGPEHPLAQVSNRPLDRGDVQVECRDVAPELILVRLRRQTLRCRFERGLGTLEAFFEQQRGAEHQLGLCRFEDGVEDRHVGQVLDEQRQCFRPFLQRPANPVLAGQQQLARRCCVSTEQ